jgi:hypothetical protein
MVFGSRMRKVRTMKKSSKPNCDALHPANLCPIRKAKKTAEITIMAILMALSDSDSLRGCSWHVVAVTFLAVRLSFTVHDEVMHCATAACVFVSAQMQAVLVRLQFAGEGVLVTQFSYARS